MATARGTALAASERMVHRVHRHPAGLGPYALPAVASGLAELDEFRLGIADLPDGGAAVERNVAHLTGRKTEKGPVSFLDISCTPVPAARAIFAPPPGRSSMACTTVPAGMFRSDRALPGRISATGPDSSMSPTETPIGWRM